MARKKRTDDEDLEIEEPAPEEIVDAEEDAVEAEDAEEPADDPLAFDDTEGEGAAGDEPPEEEEEEPVELPPRPRTPIFTIVLLILNFLAAPPFVLLAFMDFAARQQWSRATLMNRLSPLGLPFADEENAASASSQTRPRLRLDGDKIAEVYKKRPKAPGTVPGNEPFQPLDTIDEPISFRIRPSQIRDDESVKSELFQGLGEPVATLDDEVHRLEKQVPAKIDEAADKYVADAGPADKKKDARRILMRMASNTQQIEDLDALVSAANGQALDTLLKEAVQRRMLTDLLAPLNVVRPAAPKKTEVEIDDKQNDNRPKYEIEKVVELNKDGTFVVSLELLKGILEKRFTECTDAKRDDIDRRHAIALMLVGVARLKAPGANEPLFGDKALERAQVVSGLYEFTQAAGNYVRALGVLEDRILAAIDIDRIGYVVRDEKGVTRTSGFVGEYADDIVRLKTVAAEIEFTKKRIIDLDLQKNRYKKQYDERLMLLGEVTKGVVAARAETAKIVEELKQLQEELFAAQIQLSDAAERNARLEVLIDQAEKRLLKGGNK